MSRSAAGQIEDLRRKARAEHNRERSAARHGTQDAFDIAAGVIREHGVSQAAIDRLIEFILESAKVNLKGGDGFYDEAYNTVYNREHLRTLRQAKGIIEAEVTQT